MAKDKDWEQARQQKKEFNKQRKEENLKKKRATEAINLQTEQRFAQILEEQNQTIGLFYFINSDSRIVASIYSSSPEQIAAQAVALDLSLDKYEASFIATDFQEKVAGIISNRKMLDTKSESQTYEKEDGFIPALFIKGPKKYLTTLDFLLADYKTKDC